MHSSNPNRHAAAVSQHVSRFAVVVLFTLVCGCTEYYREHMGGGHLREYKRMEQARALGPYYGTGTVLSVMWEDGKPRSAYVDFKSHALPILFSHLLLVRSNSVVGKVVTKGSVAGPIWMDVIEGKPQTGDQVIGIQNEGKVERQ
jgi:hypothetical protein